MCAIIRKTHFNRNLFSLYTKLWPCPSINRHCPKLKQFNSHKRNLACLCGAYHRLSFFIVIFTTRSIITITGVSCMCTRFVLVNELGVNLRSAVLSAVICGFMIATCSSDKTWTRVAWDSLWRACEHWCGCCFFIRFSMKHHARTWKVGHSRN